MKLGAMIIVAACSSATPQKSEPIIASPPPAAPRAQPAPDDATTGTCAHDQAVADADEAHQPVAIAHCPNPLEYVRGNGFSDAPYPDVHAGPLPEWDLAAARAYACAYACAQDGARAALIGWSTYQDRRPLRNDNVAYVVAHPPAKTWTVVVMWRHAFNKWWNVGGGVHDPRVPIKSFDHAPSAAELTALLESNRWTFAADDGRFALLAGSLVERNWPGPPAKQFPQR
jgi:hypothetical protein